MICFVAYQHSVDIRAAWQVSGISTGCPYSVENASNRAHIHRMLRSATASQELFSMISAATIVRSVPTVLDGRHRNANRDDCWR